MRKLTTGIAAAALAAAAGVGTTQAASAATAAPAHHPGPSAQDVTWLKANAQTDLAEITLGQLALAKSRNGNVRMVATMTLHDHTIVLAQVRALAKKEGVKLPGAPSPAQQKQAALLKSLSGQKFNVTWDQVQILGHKQSIAQTNAEIAKGSNQAVVRYAGGYLHTARGHLVMALNLQRQLG
jgi:putative membrane protein